MLYAPILDPALHTYVMQELVCMLNHTVTCVVTVQSELVHYLFQVNERQGHFQHVCK